MTATSLEMRRIDLKGLVADIVADAQWEARERECRVDFVCNGDCTMEANPDLLRSAAENVIRNAVCYTAPGTTVEVRVDCPRGENGDAASIRVSDHGPGVPDAELSNIFRPFYRVADARDRASGGVGLGLAIAEKVARVHEGGIHAENFAGGGLAVVITLKRVSSEKRSSASIERRPPFQSRPLTEAWANSDVGGGIQTCLRR